MKYAILAIVVCCSLHAAQKVQPPAQITRQPKSCSVEVGKVAAFYASGRGKGATARWEKKVKGEWVEAQSRYKGGKNVTIAAGVAVLYLDSVTADDAGQYRYVVEAPTATAVSNVVTLTVVQRKDEDN